MGSNPVSVYVYMNGFICFDQANSSCINGLNTNFDPNIVDGKVIYSEIKDQTILNDIQNRIKLFNSSLSNIKIRWAISFSYVNMPIVNHNDNTNQTNYFEIILSTDGCNSFVFLLYKKINLYDQTAEISIKSNGQTSVTLNSADVADPSKNSLNSNGYVQKYIYKVDNNSC
jgi:hypothetical protein